MMSRLLSEIWNDLSIRSVGAIGRTPPASTFRPVKTSRGSWETISNSNDALGGWIRLVSSAVSSYLKYLLLSPCVLISRFLGVVRLHPAAKQNSSTWRDALGIFWTPDNDAHGNGNLWNHCKAVISRSRDVCREGSWIFFKHASGSGPQSEVWSPYSWYSDTYTYSLLHRKLPRPVAYWKS